MKSLSYCVFGFAFATTACFAQIDIYQSDAYSLEEMCAREAEQNLADYANAYDSCIEKNRDNPLYADADAQNSEESAADGTEQAENGSRNGNGQDYSPDQVSD